MGTDTLHIDMEYAADHVRVSLSGQLHAENDSRLISVMVQSLDKTTGGAILECSGLEYISSAGIRALLVVGKKLQAAGKGRLVLVAMQGAVKQMAELAGLTNLFPICETMEQAEAILRHGT